MSGQRFGSTAAAVVQRQLKAISPAHIVPPIAVSLILFAGFAGGLSSIANTPEFTYPDYTSFIFIFALFMGSALAAVFRGFALLSDIDSGFARRMMLASPRPMAIVVGFMLVSVGQGAVVCLILFAIGLLAGMETGGSPLEIAAIVALALLLNAAISLFCAGVALRIQSVQSGTLLMIMPVFILVFISPVYVPKDELSGWVKAAAEVNPMTALFDAGRGLLIGEPERVGLAFLFVVTAIPGFFMWARAGMRKAGERAG